MNGKSITMSSKRGDPKLTTQTILTMKYNAVFLTTVITESYRVKIVLPPMEIVRKVAIRLFVHAPEIEIFQSAKVAIISHNFGS